MVGREGLAPPKPEARGLQPPVIAAIRPPHIKITLSQLTAHPFNLPHLLSEVERDARVELALMEYLPVPTTGAFSYSANLAYVMGRLCAQTSRADGLPSPPLSDLWCQNLVSIQALNAYEASMGADPSGKLRPRIFP